MYPPPGQQYPIDDPHQPQHQYQQQALGGIQPNLGTSQGHFAQPYGGFPTGPPSLGRYSSGQGGLPSGPSSQGGYAAGPPFQGGFSSGPPSLGGLSTGPAPYAGFATGQTLPYNQPSYAPMGNTAPGQYPKQEFLPATPQYGQQYPAAGPSQASGFGALPGQFAGGSSPFGLMSTLAPGYLWNAGGSILGGSEVYVRQHLSWLSSPAMHTSFVISKQYVLTKLLLLLTPFLPRWTYTRQQEQIQGVQKYRPPRADVNAPDLYIPLMSMWTYAVLVCLLSVTHSSFKPDLMYSSVWTGCIAWLIHMIVCWLVLRALPVQLPIPWLELMAYTGYSFVHICIQVLAGAALGKWAYYIAWIYGSFCMSTFLVRTLKWVYIQELMRLYQQDVQSINYRLLLLAGFQFVFSFYLGVRP